VNGRIVEFFRGLLPMENAFELEALEEILKKIVYMIDTIP
jgi:hypothetical protein